MRVLMYAWTESLAYYEFIHKPNGPRREKNCHRGFANNTGEYQPAHLRSLISAFVIRFLEIVICKRATGGISIF